MRSRAATCQVVNGCFARGLSPDETLSLLTEEGGWNETKADPPWEIDGDETGNLGRLVDDLWRKRKEAPGRLVTIPVEQAFDALSPAQLDEIARLGGDYYSADSALFVTADEAEAKALEGDGDYLVEGWIDREAVSDWFGPPGSGKSAVVLGLGLSVAAGVPWAGSRTKQGLVLYIALERPKGMRKRIAAARKKMDLPSGLPFVLANFRPDLSRDGEGAKKVLRAIRAAEKRFGMLCRLVVIDTLARAMGGRDADAAHEIAAFLNRCAPIHDETGAHILIIHHPKKSDPRDARGSGALLGAIDTEVLIHNGAIEATKESENAKPPKRRFTLETVVLGENRAGDPVTAVFANIAVDPCLTSPVVTPPPFRALSAADELKADILAALTPGARVSVDALKDELKSSGHLDADAGGALSAKERARFHRAKCPLLNEGALIERNQVIWQNVMSTRPNAGPSGGRTAIAETQ